ncbi:MAG: TrkA family potassium uptake protein [Nocardiopsis sp. BM-2018]|nr:MAG: TrkA family potassium uptake protein [Nocardiopsis sp. BM-2018]
MGAGRFGAAVAETLDLAGHDVVVVDRDEAAVARVMAHVTHARVLDGSDEQALRDLGAANFEAVVIAIGDDLEASVLATAAAKDAGAARVVAKAPSALVERILRRVGADEVVRPERDMGVRLAQHLVTPSLVDAFSLGDAYGVLEVEAPDALQGRLASLRLPNRFGVQVVAIDRGGALTVSPGAEFEVRPGDRLVLVGSNQAVARLRAHLSG